MNVVISKIRREMKKKVDSKYKKGSLNFFKEPVKLYGVRNREVEKICQRYFAQIKHLPKSRIFDLCEQLLGSNFNEEASIAFNWLFRLKNKIEMKDFLIFERFLKRYVTNWGMCDDLCTHSIGKMIFDFPQLSVRAKRWTRSKNRWERRASAVSFIYPVRRGKNLQDIMAVSDILLQDNDDMVQKGYGWALKEASREFPKAVFEYVMKRKQKMPRTALRYAIEKMPAAWKKKAMIR